jgi:hypothetical protein
MVAAKRGATKRGGRLLRRALTTSIELPMPVMEVQSRVGLGLVDAGLGDAGLDGGVGLAGDGSDPAGRLLQIGPAPRHTSLTRWVIVAVVDVSSEPTRARIEGLLSAAYGAPVHVRGVDRIDPWSVSRCHLAAATPDVPASVVVKWLRDNPKDVRRDPAQLSTEQAALEFLAEVDPPLTSRLLAADTTSANPQSGLVVLEDVSPREPLRAILQRDQGQSDAQAEQHLTAITGGHGLGYGSQIHQFGRAAGLAQPAFQSRRVFQAAVDAGVPALVYASSVGAYAPGPKDRAVDESWPTTGLETSTYARHKAEVERILDRIEEEAPALRSVRLRPGLIFKRDAASEIRRLFAGPFVPSPLVRPGLIPAVPDDPRLVFQAVHSLDVGEAYHLAAVREDARGVSLGRRRERPRRRY